MGSPDTGARVIWVRRGEETSRDLDPAAPLLVIGRSSQADISIDDDRSSRRHAELYWEGQRWWVRDAGSRNGTYVGVNRVSRPVPLAHGDAVRCGGSRISFLWPASIRAGAISSQPETLAGPPAPVLSPTELELLHALCAPYESGVDPRFDGAPAPLANSEIATRLHLSEDGVRQRLKRLYPKFELTGSHPSKRRELAARVLESGALSQFER